jgi:glycosyltransferase involved in cell wall biosynthesis
MDVPRILHITTFLPGGAGRNITALAVAQHRAGCDVLVVADAGGEPGYASYAEYIEELRDHGVPFTTVVSTFKRDLTQNRNAAAALRSVTGRWRPGLVHAHATTPALVARLAGLGDGVPFVHTMHGWGSAKTPDQPRSDIGSLDQASAVVVPSAAAARTLREAGLRRDDVQVIPYGIPADAPEAAADPRDLELLQRRAGGRPVCLCIGTIGERKNQRLLVEALVSGSLHDAVAVFIGDGDTNDLQQHARALSVEDRVVLLGHRARASRYLPLAKALVLPSRNEGLPFAVLESLRAGVPVVASDIPEMAEALDAGRCGYLFGRDDAESLAAAVRDAFAAPDSVRTGSRMLFEERYSSARMFSAYAKLYESRMRLDQASA